MLTSAFILAALLSGPADGVQQGEDAIGDYGAWRDRLAAAVRRHDAAEELLCITTLGRRWSWSLNTLPRQSVEVVARDSELARLGQPRMQMLQMFYEVRWRHSDGSEPSRWWQQLSLDLLERGQREESFAVAAHITDPYALIALQADERYRRIARSEFVERDILKATRNELQRRQAAAADNPRDLSRIVQVARALMLLHRHADVLRLTDPLLELPQAAGPRDSPFEDLSRQLPWIFNVRAHALSAMGQHEQSLSLLRRAAQESKDDPVSHALNLASFLAALNRPQEALAAIPPLEKASPYGQAVAAMVRVKATVELGEPAALQAALDGLLACTRQFPGLRQSALVVAGREDDAVRTLLERLSDPQERSDALVELQHYQDDPAPVRTTEWRERANALRERPQVREAIDRYGHVRSYALPAP